MDTNKKIFSLEYIESMISKGLYEEVLDNFDSFSKERQIMILNLMEAKLQQGETKLLINPFIRKGTEFKLLLNRKEILFSLPGPLQSQWKESIMALYEDSNNGDINHIVRFLQTVQALIIFADDNFQLLQKIVYLIVSYFILEPGAKYNKYSLSYIAWLLSGLEIPNDISILDHVTRKMIIMNSINSYLAHLSRA